MPAPSPPTLAGALGFDAVELAANRRGELSPAQVARMQAGRATTEKGNAMTRHVIVGLSIVGGVVALVLAITVLARGEHVLEGVGPAALMALSAVATGYWGASLETRAPPPSERVSSVQGEVHFAKRDDDGWSELPRFAIDGVEFTVAFEVAAAFAQGARYRVYYVPVVTPGALGEHRARVILSGEPVG